MTLAREKYLNNMSKEEKEIRDLIGRCKRGLKYLKVFVSGATSVSKPFELGQIKHYKQLIKYFKRQLPVKAEVYTHTGQVMFVKCKNCRHTSVLGSTTFLTLALQEHCYCKKCGRKFRHEL